MVKTVIVTEDFKEPKRWWLHPLLLLTVGSVLYFTLFWFVVWPVVVDGLKGAYPNFKGWVTFLWLMALILWALPLCCLVCFCAYKEKRRIQTKMELRQQQLSRTPFYQMPLQTGLFLVQPGKSSPRVVSYPSVIVEEEDNVSLPNSPLDSPASLRKDASTKALYTGSSKRVSLVDARESKESGGFQEEVLRKMRTPSDEDDVFSRHVVFVTPRQSFVQPQESVVQPLDSFVHSQEIFVQVSESSDQSPDTFADCSLPEETSNAIFEQDEIVQIECPPREVAQVAEEESGRSEKSKVLQKQQSQSEFFVANAFRKMSVTTEAFIEFTDNDKPIIYTPGQFVVMDTIHGSDM